MKCILMFTLTLLSASTFSSAKTCSEMSKEFFLLKMDGVIGKKAPPAKERPKYIAELLAQLIKEYPNDDPVECMQLGLEKAKSEKRIQSSQQ